MVKLVPHAVRNCTVALTHGWLTWNMLPSGGALSKTLGGSLLDNLKLFFPLSLRACIEPQIPRPHTTSIGFRNQSLSWVRFFSHLSLDTFFNSHTHMHIRYFAMNMMKGRERKVKAPREQTDPGFYLKSLCFYGSWDFGFGVSAQFERSSCLLLVEKGGKKEPLPCLFALICCSRGRVCGWPKPRWHVSVQPQDEGCLIYKWNV